MELTGTTQLALTGAMAVLLGLIHLFASSLRFLDIVPRSRWLSLAGGAAVAYVFVHILPDLESDGNLSVITKGQGVPTAIAPDFPQDGHGG